MSKRRSWSLSLLAAGLLGGVAAWMLAPEANVIVREAQEIRGTSQVSASSPELSLVEPKRPVVVDEAREPIDDDEPVEHEVRFFLETESGEALTGPAWVSGCGEAFTRDGSGVLTVSEDRECSARARIRDGALFRWSASETINGRSDVVFVFPDTRTGGLGVQIAPHPDGVVVARVLQDSPAAELGLQVGDVVIEVDGEAASGLSLQDFVGKMTGPEGTEVDFVVGYDDPELGWVEEEVALTRRFLGS